MTCSTFDTLKVQGHTVPHLKALRYGKYVSRRCSFSSTSSICQVALNDGNLLQKQGYVDSQMKATVGWPNAFSPWTFLEFPKNSQEILSPWEFLRNF